jgi:ABC-type ATPase with predicted acetyltransferase domain
MVDAALEHTAAMAVRANSDAVLADSIEDKLGILRLEMIQALLDDMIAVQILDKVDDLARESLDDHLDLH